MAFWPSDVEEQGPWKRMADLTTNKAKPQDQVNTALPANGSASVCAC